MGMATTQEITRLQDIARNTRKVILETLAEAGSGQNTMRYSNPEVDRLLEEGATTLEQSKRIPIYKKLQALLREDLPFLPQQQYAEIEGTKANLVGYEPNINVRLNTWNLETWHWVA